MTNTDEKAAKFRERLINIETERRMLADDAKEIGVEMKAADLTPIEIAGIKLSVRRHFETDQKRIRRETIEEFAAGLGELADSPLGQAAMAARRFVDTVKKHGHDVTIQAPGMDPIHISAGTP